MKKGLFLTIFVLLLSSCSFLKTKTPEHYNMKAVIKTTKGDINVFLYPDGAPVTVANFVNLAQNDFYDGLTFHRIINDVLVQGGDPNGNGSGGTGYTFEDEFADWLMFDESGMLAMANSGEDTNSSQFFITMVPTDNLNYKHTIFGELVSRSDLSVVKLIREGDKILDIEVSGTDVENFLLKYQDRIDSWNLYLR